MSAVATRLTKELAEVGKDDGTSGVKAVPVNPDNPRVLKGTIKGPQGTPYEGGVFQIDINIPKQYPFEPPKMKFHTKIWHPNISSQTGAICLVSLNSIIMLDLVHVVPYSSPLWSKSEQYYSLVLKNSTNRSPQPFFSTFVLQYSTALLHGPN